MPVSKPTYATSAVTRRAISNVKKAGITIGSVRLLPCGAVEIMAARQDDDASAKNDFDRLDAKGLL